jgi:hypothetical protein
MRRKSVVIGEAKSVFVSEEARMRPSKQCDRDSPESTLPASPISATSATSGRASPLGLKPRAVEFVHGMLANQIIRNGETTWELLSTWLCAELTFDLTSFMAAIRNTLGVLSSLVPDEVLHGLFEMLDEDDEGLVIVTEFVEFMKVRKCAKQHVPCVMLYVVSI